MLTDNEARQKATDPNVSCIVQAPAGSGKTEILTQRFLRLLSTVSAPEQIVALTFTKKAANEMRARIVLALQRAADGAQPASVHQQLTYHYAANALLNDKTHHWQLLQTPQRLRITTIDSLCQTLAHAIPLVDKQTPYAKQSETPNDLYQNAARACFAYALDHSDYQSPLRILLEHLDNRQDRLLALFAEQLHSRDQWLRPLYAARLQNKADYEEALRTIEQHERLRFQASIPPACVQPLIDLAREVANLEADSTSKRTALRTWYTLRDTQSTHIEGLVSLLLTSQHTLRKAFDHHVGLKRGACPDKVYTTLKTASKQLLSELNETPDFLAALLRVRILPPPIYPACQWEALQALLTLLPLLASHLYLLFNQTNTVDFQAIAHQAQLALREDDNPTDLALYLDHTIHHLLIDEFQDTSMQQFELITQLVEGFEPHTHKTLFIVGDPMQSIYRFRGAEVGLFLHAQRHGVGPVLLTPLHLRCNFRATETLVKWTNHRFQDIFPTQDDLESGAIAYHTATAINPADATRGVTAYQYTTRTAEAQGIVACIKHELAEYPTEQIALLVSRRSQLTAIIHTLRAENIAYQGVDIDWISVLPHIRDVWSLTQALLMPAHRLAWLALLRSPWCGLCLADLHLIANVDRKKSIYAALTQWEHLHGLSRDGLIRVRYLCTVFQNALAHRHQQPLVTWLINTLEHLHVHAVLSPTAADDLEQFWQLLETFEQDGQLADFTRFEQALNTLYSKQLTPSRLQIMTIHKAKGLEFDCVILPSLSAKPSRTDKPLLRWLTLPTTTQPLVLVSPIHASHDEDCPLYDYLEKLDAEKTHYEQQRLLYVAVTRAKKRLYLFDHTDKNTRGTFRALLEAEEFCALEQAPLDESDTQNIPPQSYLPEVFYNTPITPTLATVPNAGMLITDGTSRILGIITHELLQWICTYHPATEHEVPWTLAHQALRHYGFDTTDIPALKQRLNEYINPLFHTPRGRWITQAHLYEHNEYELLVNHQGNIQTQIIDRTFHENGLCWIIDFKTGGSDAHQEASHRAQVNTYATHLTHKTTSPIHCGLYYLNTQRWIEWKYSDDCASLSEKVHDLYFGDVLYE